MKKEKKSWSCKRRSLRGKIQRSLTRTSFLSIGIFMVTVLTLLLMIIKPIGGFFTDSINHKISNTYKNSSSVIMGYQKVRDLDQILDQSLDEMLDGVKGYNAPQDLEKHLNDMVETRIEDDEKFNITVWGDQDNEDISEFETKVIVYSTVDAIKDINRMMSISETLRLKLVNVEMVINDDVVFNLFDNQTGQDNFYSKKFGDIKSVMPIYGRHDQLIGTITTSLNTDFLMMIMAPVIFVFICVALLTFLVVRIILLPFTFNLLKPILVLNKELKTIAEEGRIECGDIKIETKKPPTEIKELIDHSNNIISKLQTSYHSLEDVNDELEAQKDELEAQNIELDNQKEMLEEQNIELDAQKEELEAQNIELDAQKEELEAQNHELMVSKDKLQKAQNQLVQSEKMASMGQLTAAIMHEINTPLGAVQSNHQMMDMMIMKLTKLINENDTEGALKIVDKMKKSNGITVDAASRVGEIIRNLKNFSRIDQAKFQNADITEGIKSVLVLTSNLWKNKVTISEDFKDLPQIHCYPSMINQVFMNILVNAIHATEKDGHIEIKTDFDENNVYFSVTDDGTGIEESHLSHIFENGFTTKPKDHGTGLGLSISKDIVAKHQGEIVAYNNEEKGATFRVTLPIKPLETQDIK